MRFGEFFGLGPGVFATGRDGVTLFGMDGFDAGADLAPGLQKRSEVSTPGTNLSTN